MIDQETAGDVMRTELTTVYQDIPLHEVAPTTAVDRPADPLPRLPSEYYLG